MQFAVLPRRKQGSWVDVRFGTSVTFRVFDLCTARNQRVCKQLAAADSAENDDVFSSHILQQRQFKQRFAVEPLGRSHYLLYAVTLKCAHAAGPNRCDLQCWRQCTPWLDKTKRHVDRAGTDENRDLEPVESINQRHQRSSVFNCNDGDAGKKNRIAPRRAYQLGDPRTFSRRSRDHDAAAGKRFHASAARISAAPRALSCAASPAPSCSGIADTAAVA